VIDGRAKESLETRLKEAVELELSKTGFKLVLDSTGPWELKADLHVHTDGVTRATFESHDRPLGSYTVRTKVFSDESCAEIAREFVGKAIRSPTVHAALDELDRRSSLAHPSAHGQSVLLATANTVRRRLAVLEFHGAIDPAILAILSDQARAAAVEAGRAQGVAVMTRENLAAILKDMGRGTAACSDGECEVETARNIGADLVVTGEVVKIQDTLLLTMKLFESKGGTLLASKQAYAKDGLRLVQESKPAAAKLFE
jgi:hypothetical protein